MHYICDEYIYIYFSKGKYIRIRTRMCVFRILLQTLITISLRDNARGAFTRPHSVYIHIHVFLWTTCNMSHTHRDFPLPFRIQHTQSVDASTKSGFWVKFNFVPKALSDAAFSTKHLYPLCYFMPLLCAHNFFFFAF